jgi:nickel/cobalt exporter
MSTFSQAMLLGAWFGVLHAFDADHLATLGGLAVRNRALGACGYALRWAIGHAAALGLVAAAVLGLGLSSALAVSRYAELAVAAALLAIGIKALLAARAPADAAEHAAPDAGPHLHFLAPLHVHAGRGRASLLMGLLHGGAGSAAVLALAPLARLESGAASALYLACFSLGVAAGALAFARAFASVAQRSATRGARLAAGFRIAVGAAALATGGLLLFETLHGGG